MKKGPAASRSLWQHFWCVLMTGHTDIHVFETDGRWYVMCIMCGRRSVGIETRRESTK